MRKSLLILAVGLCLLIGIQAANAGVGTLAKSKVYSVNIIAYENCPKSENSQRISVLADFSDNPVGDTIVTLDKTNKIFLTPGGTFRVLASNACNPTQSSACGVVGACLQLPPNSATSFQIWIRLVGPPDGTIDPFLCAVEKATGLIVCQNSQGVKTRLTGQGEPSFTNYTNTLLRLPSGDPLFDTDFEFYFWNWNTGGKPHAQVWFIDPD